MTLRVRVLLGSLLIATAALAAQESLTLQEIAEAIALGKAGKVPVLKVGSFMGDFEVFIAGPVARIAAAADEATRAYRPFETSNVTATMAARVYTVTTRRAPTGDRLAVSHVVLQPKGLKGMDGVIQPHYDRSSGLYTFDRLPDGDFQVVVVTRDRPQIYGVSLKDRAKIR